MTKVSLPKDKIRILLLEGVHQSALETLQANGYHNIEYLKTSLPESELIEKIKDVHFIGIRSRTQLSEAVIDAANKLVAVGCFCIGTNQVDLNATQKRGIPVYNAPFSNTRSVAVLGNAMQIKNLTTLLNTSDVISLHVPETPQTQNMIGKEELAAMKKGSVLINASRGTVIDIDALVASLDEGHISGAAIDVFPIEPKGNDEEFESPLRRFDNVILTPHVGGSTQEAQENIGIEVAGKLTKYSDNGSTVTAVNFPEVSLPGHTGCSRLLHIHQNRPGVLTQINQAFAKKNINIAAQYLQTNADIGYVVIDVEADHADDAFEELLKIDGTIKTRILH
jgi:phosphoglycerate dehydrogenase-like enzyme